jgi:hypothetical protein
VASDGGIDVIARADAIARLDDRRTDTLHLLEALAPRARTVRGLGGGAWSPKDLLGHLESWERHALDAIAAWDEGAPAPIDVAFRTLSLAAINEREVARKATWSFRRIASSASSTHQELIDAIRAMTDERWGRPATPRARVPLGDRLGQILTGKGPFGHDGAHHPSLESFVRQHGRA